MIRRFGVVMRQSTVHLVALQYDGIKATVSLLLLCCDGTKTTVSLLALV